MSVNMKVAVTAIMILVLLETIENTFFCSALMLIVWNFRKCACYRRQLFLAPFDIVKVSYSCLLSLTFADSFDWDQLLLPCHWWTFLKLCMLEFKIHVGLPSNRCYNFKWFSASKTYTVGRYKVVGNGGNHYICNIKITS